MSWDKTLYRGPDAWGPDVWTPDVWTPDVGAPDMMSWPRRLVPDVGATDPKTLILLLPLRRIQCISGLVHRLGAEPL